MKTFLEASNFQEGFISKPMLGRINVEQRVKWINADDIGKTEDEMIILWNELHPDDPIED